MHFASQGQTQSLTWELWEEEDTGGWALFFTVGLLLFCFSAKTRWILRFFPLKRVKDKHRFWVCKRSEPAERRPKFCPETCVPSSGPAG